MTTVLLVLAIATFGTPAASGATAIHGTTTTQRGEVLLPGVEVTITDADSGRQAGVIVSDALGRFRVDRLPPGRYTVVARLAGFADRSSGPVVVSENQDVNVALDLELASVSETVQVVGQAGTAETQTSVSRDTVSARLLDVLPVAGDSYRALLPVLPGVVRQADGRISLKGARPTQGGLQVGRESGNDPSTGNFGVELPSDSVESVEVSANPYSAEDGRFSSSIVRVETRPGTNDWRFTANSFLPVPCLKICDGGSMGIGNYQPRAWFGGPLVKDRVFLAQGLQYRWLRARVAGLPEQENDTTSQSFDSFTQVDANLAAGHRLKSTLAIFPRRISAANLNTFNPFEVTANSRLRGYSVSVADSGTLSSSSVLESSLGFSLYHVGVSGQGTASMDITPEGNQGNYFNTQDRRTHVYHWTESLTNVRQAGGEHLLKAGVDLMRAAYAGTSESRPVLVRRADGTLTERFDFGGPTEQRASGTDIALFAQDRWRPAARLTMEPGVRADRDGVLERWNLSPRLGVVIAVARGDRSVLRGGIGTFYERTPLNVGAFEAFEPATVTRLAADGVTAVGPPLTYVHRTGALETPRALVWNVEYDHRFGSDVFVKVSHLRREGSREAVLEPIESAEAAELGLDSRGRSRYDETEVTVRVGADEGRQVVASYVRSRSTGNLNAFDVFFGNFRNPIVRPDQYTLAPVDVPNRLVARGTLTLRQKWTVGALVEVRNGFPFSMVDENQEFVGTRNAAGRFPTLYSCDLSLLRSSTVWKRRVRYGLRVGHVFNNFAPRDVQNNIDSPAFGTFYNSLPRRIIFTFQFVTR